MDAHAFTENDIPRAVALKHGSVIDFCAGRRIPFRAMLVWEAVGIRRTLI